MIERFRAVIAVAAAGAVAAPAAAQTLRTLRDNPAQHLEWFTKQRAYPFGAIPAGRYQAAVEAFRRSAGRSGGPVRLAASGASNGWTAIGPTSIIGQSLPAAGRVSALAMSPVDPNTVYAAGAQGGVWRTTNGGINWLPLTDDQCSLAMGALVVDPANANIIYAGTGEYTNSGSSYYGCGMLRSLDGGQTWSRVGPAEWDQNTANSGGHSFSAIVIDPTTAGSPTATTLWAATNGGLWRSTNSGTGWQRAIQGPVTDLVMDPTNPLRMWAAAGYPFGASTNGVWFTGDGGQTWNQQTNGFYATNVGRVRLAISKSNPARLYAAVQKSGDPGFGTLRGMARTDDGGATWDTLGIGAGAGCGSQCWYDMYLAVHPTNQDIVFMGGVALYRSTNGASTFSIISGPIHVDQHAMVFDPANPAIVYAGNDGGIYRSTDTGTSWVSLNNDIAITQFYPGISMHPTNPEHVLGGTQDNGTNEYTGSSNWAHVIGGDGGFTAINHEDGSTAWGETQWAANSGYSGPRRRDGSSGSAFNLKMTGIAAGDRAEFIPPLVMDPVRATRLYFGTYRLYRTTNNGENWSPISGDLSKGAGTISAVGLAPADSAMIYVGTSDGNVQVSSNYGTSFSLAAGLPNRYVTDFAFNPADPEDAWVTFSGFSSGRVYHTPDRGVTWNDVTGNLPDIPVNAIAYVRDANELVIGTDVGLYRSTDLGATWTPFVGIPNVAVLDLVYSTITGRLVAATHGRGLFWYPYTLGLALRGDVNGDFRIGAIDAQAVLTSVVGLPLPGGFSATPHGDTNCDDTTAAVDAQIILAHVVGLAVPPDACVGQFR